MPADCSNGYFYISIADGGLRIPAFRWKAMVDRRGRLEGLIKSAYTTGPVAASNLVREVSAIENRRKRDDGAIMDVDDCSNFWAANLHG